jgi:hypothetical protein
MITNISCSSVKVFAKGLSSSRNWIFSKSRLNAPPLGRKKLSVIVGGLIQKYSNFLNWPSAGVRLAISERYRPRSQKDDLLRWWGLSTMLVNSSKMVTVIDLLLVHAMLLLIESFGSRMARFFGCFPHLPLCPASALCSLLTVSLVTLSNRIGDLCPCLASALLHADLTVANVHYAILRLIHIRIRPKGTSKQYKLKSE